MKAFENFKIEKVGDERLEERIRLAYIRKTVLEDEIHELTSEGEGGVGKAYEELYDADEDFYMLLELRELRERRGAENDKPADLKGKIKKHILAIREDVKNAGFDTNYITMAMFDDSKNGRDRNSAFIYNDENVEYEKQFVFYYNLMEEEE